MSANPELPISRNDQAKFFVLSDYDFPVERFFVGLRLVNHDDIAIKGHRLHRTTLDPHANRPRRIRAPKFRGGNDLIKVGMTQIVLGRPWVLAGGSIDVQKRNGHQVIVDWLAFYPSFDDLQDRNSPAESLLGNRQNPDDILSAQTCQVPENPAELGVFLCQDSQL